MLHFVLGMAGSGKSTWCMREVAQLAEKGEKSVIIVPEQAVYSFERAAVEHLPEKRAGLVKIKSFKRICRDILNECGGGALPVTDTAQKAVLVRKALMALQKSKTKLQYYGRKVNDTSFYGMLGGLFDELRNAGGNSGALLDIASECESELSSLKFREIGGILSEYEKLMEGSCRDDADLMYFAANKAKDSKELTECNVFIDSFSGFTGAEAELLKSLIERCKNTYITLCCLGEEREDDSAVRTCRKTLGLVSGWGFESKTIRLYSNHKYNKKGLAEAADYFCFGMGDKASAEGVKVYSAFDAYREAEVTACEIERLVREENYMYRDIAVTVRDLDAYYLPLRRSFERYGIPFHLDKKETLEYSPCAVFMDCAIELAGGLKTSAILKMLKTGITSFSDEQIAALDNYCYVYSVDGEGWKSSFIGRPSGFGDSDENDTKELELVENTRSSLMQILEPYTDTANSMDNRKLFAEACGLLDAMGCIEAMERDDGPGRRNASLCIELLERFYSLLDEENMSLAELRGMLRLLAASTEAAQIPDYLDGLIICDASRSLVFNPRAQFVLGLNEGQFPRNEFSGNVFTLDERDKLFEKDIKLAGCFEECCDLEGYYLYRAVSAPTDRLYLSWCENIGKESTRKTAELESYISVFEPETLEADECMGVVNKQTAREIYMEAICQGRNDILSAMKESSAGADCEEFLCRAGVLPGNIDEETASELCGSKLILSASRIEKYEKCPFSFFNEYLLKIKPIEKAEITPAEAGNIIHSVMERLLTDSNGVLKGMGDDELESKCVLYCDDYTKERIPYSQRDERVNFILNGIRESTKRLVKRIRKEQEQSDFQTKACELDIAFDGTVKPKEYQLPDGRKALLIGKVDRVDVFEDEEGEKWLRVVDYKTGSKTFELEEALQGLNIQMLLYLFALLDCPSSPYAEMNPAGVLYMPGDPSPKSKTEEAHKAYSMNGLVLNNQNALDAMDKDGKGVYIHFTKNKNGSWINTKNMVDNSVMDQIHKRMDDLVKDMASKVFAGKFEPCPVADKNGTTDVCDSCSYYSMCGRDRLNDFRVLKDSRIISEMLGGGE